jgi:hypothetical protein
MTIVLFEEKQCPFGIKNDLNSICIYPLDIFFKALEKLEARMVVTPNLNGESTISILLEKLKIKMVVTHI